MSEKIKVSIIINVDKIKRSYQNAAKNANPTGEIVSLSENSTKELDDDASF